MEIPESEICSVVVNLTDDDIWANLEGTDDDSVTEQIRQHCVKCTSCIMTYAQGMARLKSKDPARYALFHNENLAVRKLELDRYCKTNGIDGVDIAKIKDADDYMKTCFGMLFREAGPLFYKWWEKVNPERRGKVILELIQILEEDSDSTE
jgi:hypothetical protein